MEIPSPQYAFSATLFSKIQSETKKSPRCRAVGFPCIQDILQQPYFETILNALTLLSPNGASERIGRRVDLEPPRQPYLQ